jgi:hypothetical protein
MTCATAASTGGGGRRLGENNGRSRVSDKTSSGQAASGLASVELDWTSVGLTASAAKAGDPKTRTSATMHDC